MTLQRQFVPFRKEHHVARATVFTGHTRLYYFELRTNINQHSDNVEYLLIKHILNNQCIQTEENETTVEYIFIFIYFFQSKSKINIMHEMKSTFRNI